MYKIEWLGKGEVSGPFGGWYKVVSYSEIAEFCKETIEEGGIILSITAA